MAKNIGEICDICFKSTESVHFKRHIMCVMNRRKEKEEQKDNQVKTQVMRLAKSMGMTIPESKQKIESGGITTDIAENENMNTSFLPKDIQEAIEYYEKFGKNIDKRDIEWEVWQQKLLCYFSKNDSTLLMLKEKNRVIVFSNEYPYKSHLSKDRWGIFEIIKDLEDIVEKDARSEDYCKQEISLN